MEEKTRIDGRGLGEKEPVGGGEMPSVGNRGVGWMKLRERRLSYVHRYLGYTEGNAGRRPIEAVTEPLPCTGGVVAGRRLVCSDLLEWEKFLKGSRRLKVGLVSNGGCRQRVCGCICGWLPIMEVRRPACMKLIERPSQPASHAHPHTYYKPRRWPQRPSDRKGAMALFPR